MKKPLSNKLDNITPSMTLAITAKAKDLKKQGVQVISFGAGEPDFFVHESVKKAAIEGIEKNYSKYTEVEGLYALREAICKKLKTDNNLNYSPNDIIVSSGAKHTLFTALQALVSDGDEVIIPSPYWVSYSEMAKIAGGTIKIVETKKENDFILQADELINAITPRSKVIMLNNPSNPTGAVYNKEQLKKIADICLKEGIYILSDEIYDRFIYEDATHISTASLSDEIKDITITINGLSKTYAMPGWRVGYAAANKDIISAMSAIQGHCVSHTSSISQYAAITALTCEQSFVDNMLNEYKARRKYMMDIFDGIKNLSYIKPKGAFYFFVDVSKYYNRKLAGKKVMNSLDFADVLLNNYHVAVIPGISFGNDNFVRFSYAASMNDIIAGLDLFKQYLDTVN